MFFGGTLGGLLSQAGYLILQHKRRRLNRKIRIKRANTENPGVASPASSFHTLHIDQRMSVYDYLDELKQQAKWDADKCASQQ